MTFRQQRKSKSHEEVCTKKKKKFEMRETACKSSNTVQNAAAQSKIRSEERPFQCDVCSKYFKSRSILKVHEWTHIEGRPFECEVCSKGFKLPGTLKSHLRIHSEKRPFKCQVCSKTFQRSGVLNAHMLIHSEERSYQCDMCSKAFKQAPGLYMHRKFVHAEVQQDSSRCNVCPKAQRSKSGNCTVDLASHNSVRNPCTFAEPPIFGSHPSLPASGCVSEIHQHMDVEKFAVQKNPK